MQTSAELHKIINNWFESVASGDLSWTEYHISKTPRLVGTETSG
jgi:hypothetical protein